MTFQIDERIRDQPFWVRGGHSRGSRRLSSWSMALFALSVPLDVWLVKGIGSVSTVAGLVFAFTGALDLMLRRRIRRICLPVTSLGLFVLWGWASYLWTLDPDSTLQRAQTYTQLFLVLVLMWQFLETQRRIDSVAASFVAGCLTAAIGTYVEFVRGVLISADTRYAMTGFDPNDLGVTLAIGLAVTSYFIVSESPTLRLLGLIYIPTALGAIALTASRGAFLAALAGAVPVMLSASGLRWRARILFGVVTGVAAAVLVYVVPFESWSRIWSLSEQLAGGTFTRRTEIWTAGLSLLRKHWLLGVGAGAYSYAVEPLLNWRIVAHNTFLGLGAELGLVGSILFFGPVVYIALAWRHLPAQWRVPLPYTLLAWAVGISSLTWDARKTSWFIIALGVSLLSLAREGVYAIDDRRKASYGSAANSMHKREKHSEPTIHPKAVLSPVGHSSASETHE